MKIKEIVRFAKEYANMARELFAWVTQCVESFPSHLFDDNEEENHYPIYGGEESEK